MTPARAASRSRLQRLLSRALVVAAALVAIWSLVMDTGVGHVRTPHDGPVFTSVYINTGDANRAGAFYEAVFGATRLPQSHGAVLSLVGESPSHAVSVRTAGFGGAGPILTFAERRPLDGEPLEPHDLGYAHICFEADDVAAVVRAIEANGGRVISKFDDAQRSPVIYAKDLDGNVIEVHVPLPTPLSPGSILRSARALAKSRWDVGATPTEAPKRFLHVNINARDWAGMLKAYESAGIGKATGFERSYEGPFIGELTGVGGAVVQGRHLGLAGYSSGGPTLELFTYTGTPEPRRPSLEAAGRVAIGFEVSDLKKSVEPLVAAGFVKKAEASDAMLLQDLEGNHLWLRMRTEAEK